MSFTTPAVFAFLVVLVLAPAVAGVATRTKSFLFTGRKGAPAYELYFDLWKICPPRCGFQQNHDVDFRICARPCRRDNSARSDCRSLDRTVITHQLQRRLQLYVARCAGARPILPRLGFWIRLELRGSGSEPRGDVGELLVEVGLFLSFGTLGVRDARDLAVGNAWSSIRAALDGKRCGARDDWRLLSPPPSLVLPSSSRRPGHAPRADDGSRSDGARSQR